MLKEIVKRDGRNTIYQEEKIGDAIFKAAQAVANKEQKQADRNVSSSLARMVSRNLEEKFTLHAPTVEEIQDEVIEVLIKHQHIKVSKEYIIYREERNRVRNRKSQLMKTMDDITNSASNDVKKENANIDGNTAMGSMLQYGSAISKEYCLNYVIDQDHAKHHLDGSIHIHDLDFLSMGTLTCCQIELSKLFNGGFSTGHGYLREPQDIFSYAALAAIAIQSNQNDQHGGQSVATFDYDMADGVRKTFRSLFLENLRKACSLHQIEFDKTILNTTPITMKQESLHHQALCSALASEYPLLMESVTTFVAFSYQEALKECDRKTFQAMEAFIHNLNTMHSRAGAQVPFSSINFGTDCSLEGRMVSRNLLLAIEAGLGNGETAIFPISIFKVKEGVNYLHSDPNYDLFQLACRVSSKRLFPNFSFLDSPFNLQYYRPGNPNTEATYMGCRTRVIGNVCGDEVVGGRGNISFTTINLPRIGIKHGLLHGSTDLIGFYQTLHEMLQLCIDQLLYRYQLQASKKVLNFPFLMGQGVWMGSSQLDKQSTLESVIKQGTLSVGFIGLAECLVALRGQHHGESKEAQDLGLSIVSFMREKLDEAAITYQLNFSLLATPAEGLSGRFTALDQKKFGTLPNITDKEYYTNSFHIPVSFAISAFDKIRLEAPYHALTNAGHITYIECDGNASNNVMAFELLIRAMKEAGIGYGSINHPVDFDSQCGYHGIIDGSICPKCQRDEVIDQLPFERIRRITGYLVGTLDRFNRAKQAEERDRVKHV